MAKQTKKQREEADAEQDAVDMQFAKCAEALKGLTARAMSTKPCSAEELIKLTRALESAQKVRERALEAIRQRYRDRTIPDQV